MKLKLVERLGILVKEFPLHYAVKDQLIRQIEEQGDKQNYSTNVKAQMTEWQMQSPQIDMVHKWIHNEIYNNLISSPISCNYKNVVKNKLIVLDTWGAVYNKGDYTINHDHTCAYSFAYFLNTPRGSAPLVFTCSKKAIPAKEGFIVIFPGIMQHHVPKNKCERRIILSGNYKFDSAGKRIL